MKEKKQSVIRKFLKYYKPHKKVFILDMLAALGIAVIGMCYPIITRNMLQEVEGGLSTLNYLFILGGILLVVYIVRMWLRYVVQYHGHVMGVKIQSEMRRDMFSHLQRLPYKYYDNQETGKIMSRMTNDLNDVSELAHHGPENILISSVMVIGSFAYLMTINVILTLIVFCCVPFLFLISLKMRKKMNQSFLSTRKDIANVNAQLESSVSGIRVTKAYTNANKEKEKFEVGNMQFVKSRSLAYKSIAQYTSSTSFVVDIFNVIILVAGGFFIYNGQIDFIDYSAFLISVNLFIGPINTLIGFVEMYQNGVTGFERFLEIMEETPEDDSKEAKLENVKGDIIFNNVEFRYNDEATVLNKINLNIKAGTKVAFVGASGGGKSTICHLLPKFYSISDGAITIDGMNIDDVSLSSLRRNIGIVQQDVFLFNGTIKENILYGKLDATDDEIKEAAINANIHEHIMSLPDGYNTEIGERGVRLSGGQKQRLSIARVFLKNPAILVLDEATSALDNTTEIYIQEALDKLSKGRTTLVVAHRLSTIKNADEIIVINSGEVKEQGSHDELLAKNNIYTELYNLQFRYKA